jgi:ribulose-bisphosphate carboxylase large chain
VIFYPDHLDLSGERFTVTYRLVGDEITAMERAKDICVEQTVEFPADLVPPGPIREQIFGRIESFSSLDDTHYQAEISFAVEISGFELPQLINVLFGNISIKPGIRVESFRLPQTLLSAFKGPRYGRQGLRVYTGITHRPLLCTALKPMGLSPRQLAELAYQFALGGIDLIKDDHGLANQSFCPFEERVSRCAEAVLRANQETGRRCMYFPNITSPADILLKNAHYARSAGAGGLVITAGLTGLDTMRSLADDDGISLPILSHPAFIGSFVTSEEQGISHYALYGQLMRLAGADASIYPNYGGRFSFSKSACCSIIEGTCVDMGHILPIFPAPGGGMSLGRIPEMNACYGKEVIYLIGGDLHRQGPDLVENTRRFVEKVEEEVKRAEGT